jgi:hypothetical protein
MTVSEYIPYYGMIKFAEYKTWIEGESMTVKEMFENYPDSELIDFHIHQLKLFELDGLEKVLKDNYFTTETVLPYLQELFDDYRCAGGDPLEWLNVTFDSVIDNPECYKAELRHTLRKALTEWIEVQKKIGFDSLYHYTNRDEAETAKIKAPVLGLFCNLIDVSGIDKREETESASVYCQRICNKYELPYTDRVRQNYNVKETKKLIQELTKLVLPLIDEETKLKVEKYLASKEPPKQNLYA